MTSMSQFASVADYKAALDADKSAAAGHYAAEVAKAEAEAQQAKDAARWNQFLSGLPAEAEWFTGVIDREIAAIKEQ